MDQPVSRRDILAASVVGGMILIETARGQGDEQELEAFAVPLTKHEALQQPGGAVIVKLPDGTEVLVARYNQQSFIACSAVCTHNGCKLQYDGQQGQLFCACHGSRFHANGQVAQGPARQPLKAFGTDIACAVLYEKPRR